MIFISIYITALICNAKSHSRDRFKRVQLVDGHRVCPRDGSHKFIHLTELGLNVSSTKSTHEIVTFPADLQNIISIISSIIPDMNMSSRSI